MYIHTYIHIHKRVCSGSIDGLGLETVQYAAQLQFRVFPLLLFVSSSTVSRCRVRLGAERREGGGISHKQMQEHVGYRIPGSCWLHQPPLRVMINGY